MKPIKTLALILTLALTLTSCARNLNNNVYTEGATDGIVYEGTIISARPVTVKASDKLGEKPGIGALGGGIGGAIAGSELGKGKGSTAGGVGGALAGAILGSLIEDRLNTQQGMEYLVKLSAESYEDLKEKRRSSLKGTPTVAGKVRASTSMGLKSRILSVVQGMDQIFQTGQKVYIIYNDDRPRIISAD